MGTNGFINFTPLDHWDQQQAKAKLGELYDQSVAVIDENIHWYWEAKRSQRIFSKTIRAIAILCFIASTLVPYIANYNKADSSILYLGYVLAGVDFFIINYQARKHSCMVSFNFYQSNKWNTICDINLIINRLIDRFVIRRYIIRPFLRGYLNRDL